METAVKNSLKNIQDKVNSSLDAYMPIKYPEDLWDAMRYSVLGPAKRLRAVLCIESCKLFGGNEDLAMPLACAIELIHAQSLIHDDLPCMDDDDFRRGKPSCHKKFGEALAVLAGDALIPFAFEVFCTHCSDTILPESKLNIIKEFSQTIGATGLVGGQVIDIQTEGQKIDSFTLEYIHENKTGALFRFSLRSGAILANANPKQLEIITNFSKIFGLAFQVSDDILDITGTKEAIGKTPGKDDKTGKNTYPKVHGFDESVDILKVLTENAKNILLDNNLNSEVLIALTSYIANRDR